MWGSVLRCGVGEERSGECVQKCRGRCKGGFGVCGEVWKEVRGDVGRGVGEVRYGERWEVEMWVEM